MSQSSIYHARTPLQGDLRKHPVLLDTDIGDDIDDALALALALLSPEIELCGVTTVFGDTHLRAHLATYLLHVFGREDIPVSAGRQLPLQPRRRPSGVAQAAILDGCTCSLPLSPLAAPELIVQTALAHPDQLILLCFGPLTNVAVAVQKDPRLFLSIRRIVMIGGTSGLPFPEWNIRSDPEAAQIVLASGIPITLLGWNITTRCQLCEADVERLRRHASPGVQLLSRLLSVWQRHRPRWHPRLPYLHDPLAIVTLCAPELLRFEEMTARVVVDGPLRGFMVSRVMDGPLVQAAVNMQANEARDWVMRRLLGRS